MEARFIACCVVSVGVAVSLHFVSGDWPSSKVVSIDLLVTLIVSILGPGLISLMHNIGMIRRAWTILAWLWFALLIRHTILAVSLPNYVNRDLAIASVAIWNSSMISCMMDLLCVLTDNHRGSFDRFVGNRFVVKKVEGSIMRLSPSTIVAPKGCCAICMQALRPPNRAASTRALSITRLRPRINAGNLKCHGTSQVLQTNCLHLFHVACIAKWVRMSLNTSTCPVCSRPITD